MAGARFSRAAAPSEKNGFCLGKDGRTIDTTALLIAFGAAAAVYIAAMFSIRQARFRRARAKLAEQAKAESAAQENGGGADGGTSVKQQEQEK